jgi:hypothetical protein
MGGADMPNQPIDQPPIGHNFYYEPDIEGPGLIDGLQYLYRRRIKLFLLFLIFFSLSLFIFLIFYFSTPKTVNATVALRFDGIEKQEYPSGAKFSVEDFRKPDALKNAIADAGIDDRKISPLDLATHLSITPVIPADIQSRWKKQEKDGVKREEYLPTDFMLEIDLGGLTDVQRGRLFDAVVMRYRDSVKHNQESALGFAPTWETSYEKLADSYDFWDLPDFFGSSYRLLNKRMDAVIAEAEKNRDTISQRAFRSVARELGIWYATRLVSLEATTYQGRLVKDKDLMIQRIQYRIEDLDIQIRQKAQESNEATRLLGTLEQPRAVLAGQLSHREGTPIIDSAVLDKMIKNDYVAPVVKRISKLQEEMQELEADKARLQKQLSWLPKSSNLTISQIPASQKRLIDTLSSELREITQKYNSCLDEYLNSTVTAKVLVTEGPIVSRKGYSPTIAFALIVVLGFILAIFYIAIEHFIRQARMREKDLVAAEKTVAGNDLR